MATVSIDHIFEACDLVHKPTQILIICQRFASIRSHRRYRKASRPCCDGNGCVSGSQHVLNLASMTRRWTPTSSSKTAKHAASVAITPSTSPSCDVIFTGASAAATWSQSSSRRYWTVIHQGRTVRSVAPDRTADVHLVSIHQRERPRLDEEAAEAAEAD
ncbi:hypothetical protein N7532_009747 [Penicillium argentinense]|uniref:Uncharacterized protein n=1 Tax=Penicillium argentinense TaxID=1131581 RepID=A0A9W9JXG9_9EURO|nr:uncharacterized protein N7532_009747 [Penicillium argentinense]KAJ5084976.1 hypothetical protein N7532_009747 [Penicillium argentinense]